MERQAYNFTHTYKFRSVFRRKNLECFKECNRRTKFRLGGQGKHTEESFNHK